MSWSIGQQVGLLRETGIFTIQAIETAHLVLEGADGFSYRCLKAEVVVRKQIEVSAAALLENQTASDFEIKKTDKIKGKQLPFIDLHAEELSLSRQLAVHDVFLAQLSAFKRFCNQQAQHRQSKFIVIHGAGQGKLKQEIRMLCDAKVGISMHDAQWSNGAVGASRIELILQKFETF